MSGARPRVSVIIPTYNRAELLRRTLRQLARQRLAPHEYEVIVADDGSSDGTRAVVREFADTLRIGYHFQPDQGFRAGTARNAGARLATGEVLVFLDTGAMVGPDFLRDHLAAHADGPAAVLGYAYAFNPDVAPLPGLAEALAVGPPERVRALFADDPAFLDIRHADFVRCGFDLNRRAVPWMLYFTINCSIRADDFWRVGGFDEGFHGWGVEDLEFAFRIFRNGIPFKITRDAWVIESPHERDMAANLAEFAVNIAQFLAKYPEPVVELGWALITTGGFWRWDDEYRALLATSAEPDVAAEIEAEVEAAARLVAVGERVAVFGAGARVPIGLPPAVLLDFDHATLTRALANGDGAGAGRAGGAHTGHHAIGLRTPLADGEVDTVIITSRLAGLWDRWGPVVLAEAHRIGRRVLGFGAEPALGADRA